MRPAGGGTAVAAACGDHILTDIDLKELSLLSEKLRDALKSPGQYFLAGDAVVLAITSVYRAVERYSAAVDELEKEVSLFRSTVDGLCPASRPSVELARRRHNGSTTRSTYSQSDRPLCRANPSPAVDVLDEAGMDQFPSYETGPSSIDYVYIHNENVRGLDDFVKSGLFANVLTSQLPYRQSFLPLPSACRQAGFGFGTLLRNAGAAAKCSSKSEKSKKKKRQRFGPKFGASGKDEPTEETRMETVYDSDTVVDDAGVRSLEPLSGLPVSCLCDSGFVDDDCQLAAADSVVKTQETHRSPPVHYPIGVKFVHSIVDGLYLRGSTDPSDTARHSTGRLPLPQVEVTPSRGDGTVGQDGLMDLGSFEELKRSVSMASAKIVRLMKTSEDGPMDITHMHFCAHDQTEVRLSRLYHSLLAVDKSLTVAKLFASLMLSLGRFERGCAAVEIYVPPKNDDVTVAFAASGTTAPTAQWLSTH